MSVTRTTRVSMEYVDHDHGHWCNACMKSTGIRLWIMVSLADRMHMQDRLYCYEHEGSDGVVRGADLEGKS
jgi:hypothetical protein